MSVSYTIIPKNCPRHRLAENTDNLNLYLTLILTNVIVYNHVLLAYTVTWDRCSVCPGPPNLFQFVLACLVSEISTYEVVVSLDIPFKKNLRRSTTFTESFSKQRVWKQREARQNTHTISALLCEPVYDLLFIVVVRWHRNPDRSSGPISVELRPPSGSHHRFADLSCRSHASEMSQDQQVLVRVHFHIGLLCILPTAF